MKTTLLLLVFSLVQISHQRSTPESDSYVAAVVEFSPRVPSPLGDAPTVANAAEYVSFIEKAAHKNADIIVFPEAGLTSVDLPDDREKLNAWTTFIPPPSSNYVPCDDSTIPVSETINVISCSAKKNGIYVVINIAEKVVCSNETCPTDERLFYNTNVAFDREGKIIARYRKTNLFQEPGFNVTTIPEVVTFDTDFGVTFGTFICFDILFKKPAMYLTRMKNVTDIVFPTAWFSEVPFLTAVQIQTGWAYAEDVNFLVAGYNRPALGNVGSGIYLGRQGIAKATMPVTETSELLVAVVPKKNRDSTNRPVYSYTSEEACVPPDEDEHWMEHWVHDELRRKRDVGPEQSLPPKKINDNNEISLFHDDLASYESVIFNSSIERTVCDDDFCCDFNVEVANVDPSSNYHLVVYDGVRSFHVPVWAGLYVCAVVLCSNDSVGSCGIYEKSETAFASIRINVTFENYENLLITPSSLGDGMFPLRDWGYRDRYDGKKVRVSASLGKTASNVATCGIWARDFTRDRIGDEIESKLGMPWATLTALAIVSVFLIFLYRKGWRKPWHRNNPVTNPASEGHGPYQHLRIR